MFVYIIKPCMHTKFMYICGHIVSMLLYKQMRLYFGTCMKLYYMDTFLYGCGI